MPTTPEALQNDSLVLYIQDLVRSPILSLVDTLKASNSEICINLPISFGSGE